jgi:hypothetical protein
MLSVSDRIPNDILEENLEDTASFFIYEPRNTLHAATSSQTANSRFGDTCWWYKFKTKGSYKIGRREKKGRGRQSIP